MSDYKAFRIELVGKIARRSLLPDLVGLPLLALLIWLAVGWGLRPLARMAQLLKSRDPDNLAPLLLAPLPQELEPVAASLNRLLQQVNQLIEREKRFIADAAHELRTPLAVLRIHAQNALQAASEEERERALEQLIAGVDRTTRVVTQLLTLARLEPSAQRLGLTDLDLLPLCRETLAELTPLALARGQELTLDVDELADFHLSGDAASLATLLQNLVGNALQYTPDGGQIQVGNAQLAPLDALAQIAHELLAQQKRARLVIFARQRGEPLGLAGADAEHAQPEVRHHVRRDDLHDKGQDLRHRQVDLDQGAGIGGLAGQFAAKDLDEHHALVWKIAVERRLGHARLTRDVVNAGPFEPVAQKDRPSPFQNLLELAPPRNRKSLRH